MEMGGSTAAVVTNRIMTNYKRIGKIAIAALVVLNLFLLIRTTRVWKRTSTLKNSILSTIGSSDASKKTEYQPVNVGNSIPSIPDQPVAKLPDQIRNSDQLPDKPNIAVPIIEQPKTPVQQLSIVNDRPKTTTTPPSAAIEQPAKMDKASVDVLKSFGKISGGMPDDLDVIGPEVSDKLAGHKDEAGIVDPDSKSSLKGSGTVVRAEKVLSSFGKNTEMGFTLHRYHGGHRIPSAIIIGAARTGTHQLAAFLELHPNIYLVDGQTNFFNNKSIYAKGMDWYGTQMPQDAPPGGIIIERSPGYFYSDMAPKRIQTMNATIKLILMIRNPTQRTVSEYAQYAAKAKARGELVPSFENLMIESKSQLVNTENLAIIRSLYHVHLTKWYKYFSKEQILIVNGDAFAKNPFAELKKVEEFVGLPHLITEDMLYFNSTSSHFCLRKDGKPNCYQHLPTWTQPEIDPDIMHKMGLFFKHHNQKLYAMTKERMEW